MSKLILIFGLGIVLCLNTKAKSQVLGKSFLHTGKLLHEQYVFSTTEGAVERLRWGGGGPRHSAEHTSSSISLPVIALIPIDACCIRILTQAFQ